MGSRTTARARRFSLLLLEEEEDYVQVRERVCVYGVRVCTV